MKALKLINITLVALLLFYFAPNVQAAALSNLSNTMSREGSAATSNHTIKFTTPSGIATGNTVTLTFPSSTFTMPASLTGVTIADNGSADNAVTSASWNAGSGILTITASASSTVLAGRQATIKIPSTQITNPTVATPTTYVITIGGTFGDTGKIAVVVVPNDQVSLTANIDPSITLSLSANTTAFNTLSTGSVSTSTPNITLTVGTNAYSGYTISVQDQGNGSAGGLFNSAAGHNIVSNTALLVAGTEGYGIQATSANATIAAPYNVSGDNVGQLQITPQNLASFNSSTSSNHIITVSHLAAISASSKAGSYSDTITYIATGNF